MTKPESLIPIRINPPLPAAWESIGCALSHRSGRWGIGCAVVGLTKPNGWYVSVSSRNSSDMLNMRNPSSHYNMESCSELIET